MSLLDVLQPRHFVEPKNARRVRLGVPTPKQARVNPKGLPRKQAVARTSKRWRQEHLERARATWRRYYRRNQDKLRAKNLARYHARKSA
mgnify:CR=1 FL=1